MDTNIFISSFFGGYPKRVIDRWTSGRITLCLSNAVIEEYIDVLRRRDFTGAAELNELLELFKNRSIAAMLQKRSV
jgi:predicted nucleic acid-binding protein